MWVLAQLSSLLDAGVPPEVCVSSTCLTLTEILAMDVFTPETLEDRLQAIDKDSESKQAGRMQAACIVFATLDQFVDRYVESDEPFDVKVENLADAILANRDTVVQCCTLPVAEA